MSDFGLILRHLTRDHDNGLIFEYTNGPRKTTWELTQSMTLAEVRVVMQDFLEATESSVTKTQPFLQFPSGVRGVDDKDYGNIARQAMCKCGETTYRHKDVDLCNGCGHYCGECKCQPKYWVQNAKK